MNNLPRPHFFVFATVARSFDSYHESQNIPHLIFSTFYTYDNYINRLYSLKTERLIIIRVITSFDKDIEVISHSSTTIEFIVPDFVIFGWGSRCLEFKNFFELLFDRSTGGFDGPGSGKGVYNIFSSVIFVFESLSWSNIQLLFSGLKVSVSGGSISHRHLLSTTEVMLSFYLLNMGYTISAISRSTFISQEVKELRHSEILTLDSAEMAKRIMSKEYQIQLGYLCNKKTELTAKLVDCTKSLTKINARIQVKNRDAYISRLPYNLKPQYLEETISELKFDLLGLESQSQSINLDLTNLFALSESELLDKYYKEFHNERLVRNKNLFDYKLSKFKHTHKKSRFSGRRYFSSSIRPLSSNNFLFFSYHSDVKLLGDSVVLKFIRRLSISSHAYDLLKLLHSNDSKEIIQNNIENYLITKKNNLLISPDIKNNSPVISYNTHIEYKLLNAKLVQVLHESKCSLEKLYLNYIELSKSTKQHLTLVLSVVGFDYISNVLFGRLLFIISNNNRTNSFTIFTNISYDIGKDLVNRYNYINYSYVSSKYESFSVFKQENLNKIINTDDATFYVELGSILIGWLIELKLIKTKIEIISKQEKRNILLLNDKINKVISPEQIKKSIFNLPTKLPMIVEPKKYLDNDGSIKLGGYLLNDVLYTESLFIQKFSLVEKTELSTNNKIYKMVDNLNSVSFAIHVEVLDFILKYSKKYNLLIDPDFKHPLELKSKLTVIEKRELESFYSKRQLESEILNLATIYKNCSDIYLPVRLDYRGRIYCIVEYLNYQGIELAKALLKFSKGTKVLLSDTVSINFLKIFGANCFGLDKLSFNDRIKWIDENEEGIINFENGKLLEKASNKLLFISFCIEYNKYIEVLTKNESFFITHLPIQLDATCNGFQHLSLLLSDINLAKKVNLNSSNWNQTPEDFYSSLSLSCKIYFDSELELNKNLTDEIKESYKRLSNLEFKKNRSLVKKTIMTIPYNSTKYANIMDMKSEFKKSKGDSYIHIKDKNFILKEIDFKVMANTLYFCLYRDFPKLESLLNYFKDIAKISNKLGISIPWTLPSGLIVKQKYFGTKKIKFKPFIYTKDLLTLNILDKNKFNSRKQIRALMPNLVHSLDAVNLALLVDNFFKEDKLKNFYSVHDCFTVTCNNVKLIADLLKLSYYNIYIRDQFLLNFDLNFKNFIKSQFGENSYSEKTKLITVINEEGETFKIKYPDIHEVFKPQVLDILNSSYLIN